MLALDQTLAFAAAVVLTLTPGPDNLMVLSTGPRAGRRAGAWPWAGLRPGCLNHTLAVPG